MAEYVFKRGQKGDGVTPTPYEWRYVKGLKLEASGADSNDFTNAVYDTGNMSNSLRNKLSTALRSTERAALALTIAGAEQSALMVAGRARSLMTSYSHLKRGDVKKAAAALRQPIPPHLRRVRPQTLRKDASGAWLEWSFGWVPAYQDIHSAIDNMYASPAITPVRVSTKGNSMNFHQSSYRPHDGWGSYNIRRENHLVYQQYGACGCSGVVENPALALASSLGLTNPTHVAWDAVPFSFVVDWFIPVGNALKSIDAFYGFRTWNEWSSVKVVGHREFHHSYLYSGGSYSNTIQYTVNRGFRGTSLPSVSRPQMRQSVGSLWQAITSVALLQQVFGKTR